MTPLPLSSTAALSAPLFTRQTSSTGSSSGNSTSSSGSAQQTANLASQNVFLQLLVAQLKNQDPQQPTDGTQFVTELAQFTTLQEDTQTANDLNTILSDLTSGLGVGGGISTAQSAAIQSALNQSNAGTPAAKQS
ncbi:MAG TPA: flagellar hook capping FlgD N-terminal domain-containing protein [Bryobacteraceae bacterium]|nr:flagellar hook capping FlgD N-terminal domain-containing protein [Bryobacteraceae bacterium]